MVDISLPAGKKKWFFLSRQFLQPIFRSSKHLFALFLVAPPCVCSCVVVTVAVHSGTLREFQMNGNVAFLQVCGGHSRIDARRSNMEHSDATSHRNGRQRKLAGANLHAEDTRDVYMTSSETEEDGDSLIRGSDSESRGHRRRPGIRGELGNVLLLLFLYVLQGIPLGLAGSIPLILQSKSVSYRDQAFFSFVFWPFSLKLLWAPLVDALYFSRFGRRYASLTSLRSLSSISPTPCRVPVSGFHN